MPEILVRLYCILMYGSYLLPSRFINYENHIFILLKSGSLWAEAESLAADFDGSLSGLGADLSSNSYDMSEALLALPSLYNNRNASNNSSPPAPNPNVP